MKLEGKIDDCCEHILFARAVIPTLWRLNKGEKRKQSRIKLKKGSMFKLTALMLVKSSRWELLWEGNRVVFLSERFSTKLYFSRLYTNSNSMVLLKASPLLMFTSVTKGSVKLSVKRFPFIHNLH